MFVTETFSINCEDIKEVPLEFIASLKPDFDYGSYRYREIIYKIIVLKKISNYLKSHPDSRICEMSLGVIMKKIRNKIRSFSPQDSEDYRNFIINLGLQWRDINFYDEKYIALFYTDTILEALEINRRNLWATNQL